jgi:hypothetical protein
VEVTDETETFLFPSVTTARDAVPSSPALVMLPWLCAEGAKVLGLF